jgi:DNA-binding LacI/PurR family transcriptional regulator
MIPASKPPTMRDIARRVGVSPATVSLVLSNHPSISAGTRQRVLDAQREMGYTVNRFAQQFARNTRRAATKPKLEQLAFCLIGTTFDNTAYAPFLHGIVNESQARHLHLFTQSLDVSVEGRLLLSSTIRNGGVDGIIVSGVVSDAALAVLEQFRVPVVVLGNHHLRTNVARVELDLRRAGSMLAENLVARRHRNLAFIVEKVDNAYEADCLQGVRACLSRHHVPLPASHVLYTGQAHSPAAELIGPLFQLDPMPTAIITTDVRVAEECVAELRAHQIAIPRQVEIATLAVNEQARRGVRYRRLNLGLERCGRLAVRRLQELVENPGTDPSVSVLRPLGWIEELADAPSKPLAAAATPAPVAS